MESRITYRSAGRGVARVELDGYRPIGWVRQFGPSDWRCKADRGGDYPEQSGYRTRGEAAEALRQQVSLRASLREQLDECTDRELTAYWNIQQFPGLRVTGDEGVVLALKLLLVDELLTERGIPHEYGKLTSRVAS